MDEKEQRLARDEFRTTRDTLTSLSIQRMFEFENRENRIVERKHSSIIAFSSLAIAIVAIVFPIYTSCEDLSVLSGASVFLLLISALYGICLIIFSNEKEGVNSKLQNDAEQGFLSKRLEEVTEIYSEAIDGSLKKEQIEQYLKSKEEGKRIYNQETQPITEYSHVWNRLYYLFLALFSLGFFLFVLSMFTTVV